MCRDVKYIILLYSSLRNYHNTNTDATSHSVTTGNHSSQIKQQQWSVLLRCLGERKPSEFKGDKMDSKVRPTGRTSAPRRQEAPAVKNETDLN